MKQWNFPWRRNKHKNDKSVVQVAYNEDEDRELQFYVGIARLVSPADNPYMTIYDFIYMTVTNDTMYMACLSMLPVEFSEFVAHKYPLWAEEFVFKTRIALQYAIGYDYDLTLVGLLNHIHFAGGGEDWDFNIDKYLDDTDCRHDSMALCEEIIRQCLKAYDIDIPHYLEETMAEYDDTYPEVRKFWNSKKNGRGL